MLSSKLTARFSSFKTICYSLLSFFEKIRLKKIAFSLITIAFLLSIWFLIMGGYLHLGFTPSPEKAKEIQPFMTAFVAPLFALAGTLLVFENLRNQTNQQLSTIFFGMINLHHKIADNIKDTIEGVSESNSFNENRVFFDDLAFRIVIDYDGKKISKSLKPQKVAQIKPNKDSSFNDTVGLERLNAIYFFYFHIYQSSLGHYFRNLFHVVTYIDEAKIDDYEKKKYLRILRSQLSNYEILLLGYNCMSVYGKKFKPLVEKYQLLKNLNFEDNLSNDYFIRLVDPEIWVHQFPHLENEYKKHKTIPHR